MALQRDDSDTAKDEFRKVFGLGLEKQDPGYAFAELGFGDILYRMGEIGRARHYYLAARKALEGSGWGVSGEGRLARLSLSAGEYRQVADVDQLWRREQAGPWGPPESAQLIQIEAEHAYRSSDYPRAEGLLREILNRVSEADYPEFVAQVRLKLAQVYSSISTLDKARVQVEAARKTFESIGNVRGLGMADLTEGKIDLADGKIDEAARVLKEAINKLKPRDEWHLADANERMAGIEIRRSDYGKAETLLESADRFFRKVDDKTNSAQLSFRLALVKFANRDYEGAEKLLNGSIDRYKTLGADRGVLRASWARGELAVATGNLEDAKAYLEAAEGAAGGKFGAEVTPHLQVLSGGIAFLEGDPERAEELLTEAAKTFRRLGLKAKEAEARLKLAILHGGRQRRKLAARELDASRKLFESLEETFGLARVEFVGACALGESVPAVINDWSRQGLRSIASDCGAGLMR